MTAQEFIHAATQSGLATTKIAKEYVDNSGASVFSDSDFESVYRYQQSKRPKERNPLFRDFEQARTTKHLRTLGSDRATRD